MQLKYYYSKLALGLVLFALMGCATAPTETEVTGPTATFAPLPTSTLFPTAAPTETPPPTPAPLAGEQTIGDPYSPELGNTGYDVLSYTLKLALDPAIRRVNGDTTIAARAEIDGLEQLSLDFVGFEVDRVRVDDGRAKVSRDGNKLIINLPEPLSEGQEFTLAIEYSGEPEVNHSDYLGGHGLLGLIYNEGSVHALSEPDGSAYWFPNNDHPRDKALFHFEITVPEALTAVANGTLVEVVRNTPLPDGTPGRTFIWTHDHPMATYLATIAVGDFVRQDALTDQGVLIRSYVPQDTLIQGQFEAATANIGEAVDWMSDLVGPYPFEAFGFVVVNTFSSLETQTMVLFDVDQLREEVAIHELAHMWFGDHVSLDSWGEMWRNEGFATYLELLWEFREDPEGLDGVIDGLRQSVSEHDEENAFPMRNPPRSELFGFKSYLKGALFLHELRQEIGDTAFFSGIRSYLVNFGGGTATDDDFLAEMEFASGVELDGFFYGWLDEVAATEDFEGE